MYNSKTLTGTILLHNEYFYLSKVLNAGLLLVVEYFHCVVLVLLLSGGRSTQILYLCKSRNTIV